jgi:hypothetical protein
MLSFLLSELDLKKLFLSHDPAVLKIYAFLCFKVQPQEIFTSVFLHARIHPALDEHSNIFAQGFEFVGYSQ